MEEQTVWKKHFPHRFFGDSPRGKLFPPQTLGVSGPWGTQALYCVLTANSEFAALSPVLMGKLERLSRYPTFRNGMGYGTPFFRPTSSPAYGQWLLGRLFTVTLRRIT